MMIWKMFMDANYKHVSIEQRWIRAKICQLITTVNILWVSPILWIMSCVDDESQIDLDGNVLRIQIELRTERFLKQIKRLHPPVFSPRWASWFSPTPPYSRCLGSGSSQKPLPTPLAAPEKKMWDDIHY